MTIHRHLLEDIANVHPAEFSRPAPARKSVHGVAPPHRWDNACDIDQYQLFLVDHAEPAIEGQQGDKTTYEVACVGRDMGISEETTITMMLEHYNSRCNPPWSDVGLRRKVRNAFEYSTGDAGSRSLAGAFQEAHDGPQARSTSTERTINGLSYCLASEVVLKPVIWLWPGRFAVGKINFIAGHPDQGKSQLTCDIAARVSCGGEWPNGEGRAEQGSVVILSAEDDPSDTIVPRLLAASADIAKVTIVKATVVGTDKRGRRMFNLAEDLERLTALVAKLGDVRLVIIDPISAYMGGKTTADTYKNTEVRAVLAPLAEWATRHTLAVLFVSHFNKSGTGRALSRLTDSLAFGALARCGWLVVAEENETGRTGRKLFLSGKNNLAADAGGLAYTIEERTIESANAPFDPVIRAPFIKWEGPVTITADEALGAAGTKPTAVDSAVTFLEDLLANGPKPSKAIKEQGEVAGHAWRTLRRAKDEIGVVAKFRGFGKSGQWMWRLPDSEAAELD